MATKNYNAWTMDDINTVLNGIDVQLTQNKNLSKEDRKQFKSLKSDLLQRRNYLLKSEENKLNRERSKREQGIYEFETERREREQKELTAAQRRRRNEEITKDILGTNFQPRDFTSQITAWTATQAIRKPYTRSGLRNEFVSRGYTGRSGFPELDNMWSDTTGSTTKGRVKGNLSIGSRKFSNGVKVARVMPNLYQLSPSVGKGEVIMPTIGILKFKKRKF